MQANLVNMHLFLRLLLLEFKSWPAGTAGRDAAGTVFLAAQTILATAYADSEYQKWKDCYRTDGQIPHPLFLSHKMLVPPGVLFLIKKLIAKSSLACYSTPRLGL